MNTHMSAVLTVVFIGLILSFLFVFVSLGLRFIFCIACLVFVDLFVFDYFSSVAMVWACVAKRR